MCAGLDEADYCATAIHFSMFGSSWQLAIFGTEKIVLYLGY